MPPKLLTRHLEGSGYPSVQYGSGSDNSVLTTATVSIKATYEPDPPTAAVYAELLKEFVNLYKETKGIHKRLNGRRLHSD